MEHRNEGRANLHQQFRQGREGIDIIEDAQNDDHHRPQKHSPVGLVHGDKDQRTEEKAQENGQPTHPGDRVVVHPSVVFGNVHGAHALGNGLDHGGGNKGNQQRHHEGCGNPRNDRQFQCHAYRILLWVLAIGLISGERSPPSCAPSAGSGWRWRPPSLPPGGRGFPDSPYPPAGARSPPGWGGGFQSQPPPRRV